MKSIIALFFILATALAEDCYIGPLTGGSGPYSDTKGEVYMVNRNTILVKGFTMKKGPDVFWYDYNNKKVISNQVTTGFTNQDVTFALSDSLDNFSLIGPWCKAFDVTFGQMTINKDAECFKNFFTPSPTPLPTPTPTPAPTKVPTPEPTKMPLDEGETHAPTTGAPTMSPTMSPTMLPTTSPTDNPTFVDVNFNNSASTFTANMCAVVVTLFVAIVA